MSGDQKVVIHLKQNPDFGTFDSLFLLALFSVQRIGKYNRIAENYPVARRKQLLGSSFVL
jgi:hypothetical protein